jgi:hypothetical protein
VSGERNLQPELRERANHLLRRLSSSEREALLIKCWMSHDARWFAAVAQECGMEVANRLNQTAARGVGKVEARRIARALRMPPVTTVDDLLFTQEALIGLVGPELLEYSVFRAGDDASEVRVRRCFASDNAARAGIADSYECGIFARIMGWFDALELTCEMTPPLGKCLQAEGKECVHRFALTAKAGEATETSGKGG